MDFRVTGLLEPETPNMYAAQLSKTGGRGVYEQEEDGTGGSPGHSGDSDGFAGVWEACDGR